MLVEDFTEIKMKIHNYKINKIKKIVNKEDKKNLYTKFIKITE